MDEPEKQKVSLFRYRVIAALLHGGSGLPLCVRMEKLAGNQWNFPDGRTGKVSQATIEKWYYAYRNSGLQGLEPAERCDSGGFRSVSEEVRAFIDGQLELSPPVRTSVIIRRLDREGLREDGSPGDSTVYRYVRSVRPEMPRPSRERRSYEAPYPGSLWQTDIMYGPHIPEKNDRGRWRKKRTYLIAVMDDHSRLHCHGQFCFSQNETGYLHCLKTALLKRGIPERIYCDNGKVFLSQHVKCIAAELGTTVIHTEAGDCEAKGKIERFFRTVRDCFLNPFLSESHPENIDRLNSAYWRWVEEEYNLAEHSSLHCTPIEKWTASSHRVRLIDPGRADELFRVRETRCVKKDGTFSFRGAQFETSWMLAGKKVTVTYDPFDPDRRLRVSFENSDFGYASPLDRGFNSGKKRHRKRKDSQS